MFRVVGFVLRWGVRLFGGMVFFPSARCRACCRFCLSCVAWPPRSVGLCFVFNVSDVIEPGAITPHPLPSIGFPCQNHLPSVVLPRALSTHAFRVLPNTIALVQVMPVISYQLSNCYFTPFDTSITSQLLIAGHSAFCDLELLDSLTIHAHCSLVETSHKHPAQIDSIL